MDATTNPLSWISWFFHDKEQKLTQILSNFIQLVHETLYEFRFAGFYQENKALLIYKWTPNKSGNELMSYNFLNWFLSQNKMKLLSCAFQSNLRDWTNLHQRKHYILCAQFPQIVFFFFFFANDNIYWWQSENNNLKWLKWNKNTWNWSIKHLHTLYTEQTLHIWKQFS